jgi:uncharacterized protein (TIGR02679 family)
MTLERYRTPAWSWLTGPVRAQLDESAGRQSVTVDFDALPAEAADRYADLLGLRVRPAGRTRVNLTRIDAALRAIPGGMPVIALLEALDGPLQNRRDRRADLRTARANVWAAARQHPALAKHQALAGWLADEQAQSARLPADPDRRGGIITAALDVAEALPAGGIGRARLSWQVLRDTKALSVGGSDQHRRACVLRAVAALAGRPTPSDLAAERELWEAVGVSVDPLSSRVLVAGLAPGGDHAVARALRARTAAGLASVLTLADIEAWSPEGLGLTAAPGRAFVCENPEVVIAALGQLGTACPVLVCTEGRPHLAAVRLVSMLVAAGARVSVHTDFDWDGLAIAATVIGLGAEPWRMSASDYDGLVARAASQSRPLPTLTGKPVATPWSPDLEKALRKRGVEIHEEDEALLTALLRDLAAPTAGAAPVAVPKRRWLARRRGGGPGHTRVAG